MYKLDDKHPTRRGSNPVDLFRATTEPNEPSGPLSQSGSGPDGSFVSTGACNLGVPGSNPGRL